MYCAKNAGIKNAKGEINLDLIIEDIGYLKKYLGKVLNIEDEKSLTETENNLYGYLNIEN